MKEYESISEYLTCVVLLTNHMKSCGESINDLQKIEKVLRSMIVKFDYIVVSIRGVQKNGSQEPLLKIWCSYFKNPHYLV